ncbi:Hok/Gef family protein [Cronobacter sakazakii]
MTRHSLCELRLKDGQRGL